MQFHLPKPLHGWRAFAGSPDLVAGQLRDSMAKTNMQMPDKLRQHKLAGSGTIKFCRAHNLPLGKLRAADASRVD